MCATQNKKKNEKKNRVPSTHLLLSIMINISGKFIFDFKRDLAIDISFFSNQITSLEKKEKKYLVMIYT
jgi:hypothetical protein